MRHTNAFYQNLLFRYLIGYGIFHVLLAVCLLLFERGWGLFAYLWLFVPHLPIFLVGALVSFLGKKTQNRWVWLEATLLFVLSNVWWVYSGLQGTSYRIYFYPIIVTLVPIFATIQLAYVEKLSPKNNGSEKEL
ncbi:hypothetical protein [Streptococcus ovuberis]|uniref:Uncharacterized protein n=1 Tax=Streptococcus ovuberis TaxID=1936207 RepID=A0A7X6MZ00_9STRE|nr:hypothetical protein [Streptococcus ovuberis]NKZ21027.1 hypothetical protein [Streptococcus ovuberis]